MPACQLPDIYHSVMYKENQMQSVNSTCVNSNYVALLCNSGRKTVKMSNQLKHLKSMKNSGCIPKGIVDQTRFKVSIQDEQFQKSCQDLMDYAASRLVDIFLIYYATRSSESRHSHYQLRYQYKSLVDEDTYNNTINIAENN